MGTINILDAQVSNLIAAGEVVERPASAIKELLENSIDAGATQITAEIKNGGISLMRITDNGCGMTKDDVTVCIKRHATSKIKTSADLDGIATLGFRGEALAAIASVSHLRIMTKSADSELGIVMESRAGSVVSVEDAGGRNGTTVIVEELFANVPARRKFLKRDISETAAVSAVIEKIALSRPDIAIKFIADGTLRFATDGDGNLLNVIYAVLGRDFSKKMTKVHDMTEAIEVDGYIGTPENNRGNRNFQNFFINGRYVKCLTASAALEQAFSSYIPTDRFPCCVLNLTINPAFVDVNVHPQKLEVKFSNEKPVFNAVYCAVRNTLINNLSRPKFGEETTKITGDSYKLYSDILTMKLPTDAEAAEVALDRDLLNVKYEQIKVDNINREKPEIYEPSTQTAYNASETDIPAEKFNENTVSKNNGNCNINKISDTAPFPLAAPTLENNIQKTEDKIGKDVKQPTPAPYFRVAGVAFNCYIFVELDNKIIIVDKHAAHERIIFEQMKENMNSLTPVSQILLIPLEIKMTPAEYAAACEYREEIKKVGFDFTEGDTNNTTALLQYPSGLSSGAAADMFAELASRLADGTGDVKTSRDIIYEKALYQASCKAAVKAGREDIPENIRWIVERVLTQQNIRYCPHGRPVAFEMTKTQFEKQFDRL